MKTMLFLCLLLTACSFKKSPAPPAPPPPEITISWEEGFSVKRGLTQGPEGQEVLTPITLPYPFPGRITIEGGVPLEKMDEVTVRGPSESYALASTASPGRIELVGLPLLLDSDKKSLVTLFLRSSSGEAGSLKLPILASPEILGAENISASSLEGFRRFEAPSIRLDLIRAVKLTNNNLYPVELKVGRFIKGHMERQFTIYEVIREECSHRIETRSFQQFYYGRFALLPIDDNLPSTWSAKLFETPTPYRLESGEDILIGLYGDGPELASFLDHGVPPEIPEQVRAPVSCHWVSCPDYKFCKEKEVVYGSAPAGRGAGEVRFLFDENTHAGTLRYANTGAELDPVMSPVEVMPANIPLL